ncbi:unnamed protein product [Trichobilharzia regenti]|nr:unnamed protein product [Trichobilharzia regenti]
MDYLKRRKYDGVGVRYDMNKFASYDDICDHESEYHLRGVDLDFLNSLLSYFEGGFPDFHNWFQIFL